MIHKIIKEIQNISGKYSPYEIFSDWIKATALSIANATDMVHGSRWHKREQAYMEIAYKHQEDMKNFSDMTGMLAMALEENMEDVLGRIYMMAEMGSKATGQFFTPVHISKMMADMLVKEEKETIYLNEPSTGSGGAIIAAANTLKKTGIDYQRKMVVTAQDIDYKAVYMTYVQLSLLGIKAKVIQGDTLKNEKNEVFYTPAYLGMMPWI